MVGYGVAWQNANTETMPQIDVADIAKSLETIHIKFFGMSYSKCTFCQIEKIIIAKRFNHDE